MAIFKCKMCGGDLNIESDINVVVCEYCNTKQTVPVADNEKKLNLFNRANRLRINNEFDKAAGIYESIIAEFPEEAEAYWGLCLCNYGIEYVDDPITAKKIPTCHRASFEKLANDENFNLAMEYADVVAQKIYRDEAREIDRIMDNILLISKNEKPYDVFICYKETDEKGDRTIDSVLAQDIYDALTAKGMKVFFARLSLEDKLGQMYEPYIFAALNSAKVMLCVGTKYEYFHAVWVKNEWSRFLKLIAKDKTKLLIPCYKDIDAYDMPEEFKALQAQDMGKIGFIQDLVRGVEKITGTSTAVQTVNAAPVASQNSFAAPLVERAFMFLEDEKWSSADEYCEKALDIEPKNPMAYIGKFLVELKAHRLDELSDFDQALPDSDNLDKAKRYADENLSNQIDHLIKKIDSNIYKKIEAAKYKKAERLLKFADKKNLKTALKLFEEISGYCDADKCAAKCKELLENYDKNEELYNANKKKVNEKLSVLNKLYTEKAKILNIKPIDVSAISVPAEEKIKEIERKIQQLNIEYASLGIFKKKEKQAILDKIEDGKNDIAELNKLIISERSELAKEKIQEVKAKADDEAKKLDSEIAKINEELYQFVNELLAQEDFRNAETVLHKIYAYKDSSEKLKLIPKLKCFDINDFKNRFSVTYDSKLAAAVDSSGRVVAATCSGCESVLDYESWEGITSVSCGAGYNTPYSIVGVKSDNTLVCTREFQHHRLLETLENIHRVGNRTSSMSFYRIDGSSGYIDRNGVIKEYGKPDDDLRCLSYVCKKGDISYYIGIKEDGSLGMSVINIQTDTRIYDSPDPFTIELDGFDFSGWDNLLDIKYGYIRKDSSIESSWVVGLKTDGTVVATGTAVGCYPQKNAWKDAREIVCTQTGTVAITESGKMLSTPNAFGKYRSMANKVKSIDFSNVVDLNITSIDTEECAIITGITDNGKIFYCLARNENTAPDVLPEIDCDNVVMVISLLYEIVAICDDGSLKYVFGPKDYAAKSAIYKLIKENPDLRLF